LYGARILGEYNDFWLELSLHNAQGNPDTAADLYNRRISVNGVRRPTSVRFATVSRNSKSRTS